MLVTTLRLSLSLVLLAGVALYALAQRPHQVVAIPIEKAISIAYRSAKQWRSDAQLQFVTSRDTDMDLQDKGIPGLDGRRRAWSFQFKDPETHEIIIVDLWDSAVTEVIPSGTTNQVLTRPEFA